MSAQKILLLILAIYLIGFFAHALFLKKTVYGDGIYYYSWTRSVVIDADINFTNEYRHFGITQPTGPSGVPANKYAIGSAIAWVPSFIWIHGIIAGDGYGLPYQLAVGVTSVLYAWLGLLLLFRTLLIYFSPRTSVFAILGVALATNLFFYGSIDTVNSHAVSFFAVSVFLALLFKHTKQWAIIGFIGGYIALTRTQDALIILLALPFLKKPRTVLLFLAGVCVAFLPQLIAWQTLYGNFWISPYLNTYEGFNFLTPNMVGVLFNPANGLVLWTPIILLGFIGLLRKPTAGIPTRFMALIVLLELYVVASWSIWWQGASYSGRMFVSVLPLLTVGLASFIVRVGHLRGSLTILMYALVGPLALINALLIVWFLLRN